MVRFEKLQTRLAAAVEANTPGSGVPHVVVVLPSFSLADSLRLHYADRIPGLEHRYLLGHLLLPRIETCELVFVTCEAPAPEVLDYYARLVPPRRRADMRRRLHIVEVPDRSLRSLASKLLDRPDLIKQIRDFARGRPAFIEPWNVTAQEMLLARRLGMPVNGTSADLWSLGFKSSGRRLFAEAGVPRPAGREDVRTVEDVVDAAVEVRSGRPGVAGVVVKTDNSGAGDGNQLVFFDRSAPPADWEEETRRRIEAFPEWYQADLATGGVVEELITGEGFSSPSVQLDLRPDGQVTVLSTHDQVLGGPNCQVYTGCRFPADAAYASLLAEYGAAVGAQLARRGAVGRAGVDFASVRSADGGRDVYALEINLRKGGTTHPYSALRHLVPGGYDAAAGVWVCPDGSRRYYEATDSLVDAAWLGRPASDVIRAVECAGLRFDRRTGTGVVLHMLSCLAVDGRLGLTAIGTTREHAAWLYAATVDALSTSAPALASAP